MMTMFRDQIHHIWTHGRLRATMLLLLLLPGVPRAFADNATTPPRITIGGSVYGGGLKGAINIRTEGGEEVAESGTTSVTIYEGEIGSADVLEDGLGNVFGGGFGPAARVIHTTVKMYGGTVWNSLYGGGEIAAVGIGYMDPPIDKIPRLNHVERQGTTLVEMYRGDVLRNVFGGGRGFTYALNDGSMGNERLYTDGYVFGSTKVRIYGGNIGTPEGVADGYGNVFGGGDVGFLYSGNEEKVVGSGVTGINDITYLEKGKTYYAVPKSKKKYPDDSDARENSFFADPADLDRAGELSIACDVVIEPWCRVKSDQSISINGSSYAAGEYVKTSDLNYMVYKEDADGDINQEWENLEDDGINIYNAVFAGGNVSTGDDKVYAETTTVYGNVAATVNDLYYRDLVTIGTEHVGGLYGDGNLTFANGYRELSLSCYGTDFYHLKTEVTTDVYENMLSREKAYYQIKYRCTEDYGSSKYKEGDVIQEGVYDRMSADEQAHWVPAGFRSKYDGRLLNTIQRADFVGVFGSRLVLQGALDRVLTKEGDELSFVDYTLNRIGELSLNKQVAPGKQDGGDDCIGNYFGIYNQVNYLGALTSDVRFIEDQWKDADNNTEDRTYAEWKEYKFTDSFNKNVGTSENHIALASGVALELKQEPTENASNNWGVITGVIQLELINVTQGEGGGFVYARNEHGKANRYQVGGNDYVRKFLSPYNNSGLAATHEEYEYDEGNLQEMQTSGNFIQSPKEDQYIVDDCYPVHGKKIGGDDNPKEAHYWYIRGSKYVYNQHISVYTGAAKRYQVSKGIELATSVTEGKLILKAVHPGYYCNIDSLADPIYVNDVAYAYGDPMSWYEYDQLEKAGDANVQYFSPDTSELGQKLNNMSHDNGFVLTLEFDDRDNLGFWAPTTQVTSPDDANATEYGPSFSPSQSGAYGQRKYEMGSYIPASEVTAYNNMLAANPGITLTGQAQVASSTLSGYWLCLQSLQLTGGGSMLLTKGELVPDTDVAGLVRKYMAIKLNTPEDQVNVDAVENISLKDEATNAIESKLTRCYKVTASGNYGGSYYTAGQKYNALDGWGLLVKGDREEWQFNNDALDLLNVIDKYWNDAPDDVNLTRSPQAVMSLYMSRDSRLLNLRKDKNLTVHFQYAYNDGSTTRQEDHYINITIEFKDELPDVGELEDPDMVLPGTKIAFKQPPVVAGAYNVTGGGWEYYANAEDAAGHINGTKFNNRETPFFWYQDGYWVNYYAVTMVGRQYSKNPVQVKVANYHDLKRVVEDTDNYLGIGMKQEGQRNHKVYINDYTDDEKSGLDMLKTLFDKTYSEVDDPETDDVDESKGLKNVPGCSNLEIILRSDLAPQEADSWTSSIGSGDQCFGGNLHGDGYTISGLNASLFNKLCGNVYNLGVTGSFTGSGIADTNGGSIQNCWVYTTGSPASGTKPVANDGTIVNSYYNNKYAPATNGGAIRKDANAFYNGSVAYELNGFNLKKNNKASEGNLDNLTADYVENRYADGDFVYADGTIPTEDDSRYWETKDGDGKVTAFGWTPKNPDDYIFFGQRLTYGYVPGDGQEHQDKPTRINETMSNRVYRTPAYIQSDTPVKAYYNKAAVFAAKSADGEHDAYPGMTAIDFTGHHQPTWVDHEGLTSFMNADLTRNLLVYAPSTETVVQNYFDKKEPTYQELSATPNIGARSVDIVPDATIADIRGHAVYKSGNSYQTAASHFLVDRQDIFVPIAYTFASGKRMWYQRKPLYVDKQTGWEVISLPFDAELVTTQQKGEITHFYKTSAGETFGDNAKGHEYWLREYKGTGISKTIEGDDFFEAAFDYPNAGNHSKQVSNVFLWQYYYSKEQQQDVNTDEYQTYYKEARTYSDYPYITAGKPYLVGFPGARYYEFDLSGTFAPKYTAADFDGNNAYVKAQTITFASASGGSVPVSSITPVAGTGNDYGFYPCLYSSELTPVTSFTMDATGSHFAKVPDVGDGEELEKSVPFRPYFVNPSASTRHSDVLAIIFGVGGLNDEEPEKLTSDMEETIDEPGQLSVRAEGRHIIVSSTLGESVSVRIVNISGIAVRTFTIAPGETVETPVNLSGVYIVNRQKIAVK